MKTIAVITVSLFLMVANIEAFVCTGNFCDTSKCSAPKLCDSKTQILVPKGSTCGCCDACYTKLSEGQRCVTDFLGGPPFEAKCGDGLVCDVKSGQCVKSP